MGVVIPVLMCGGAGTRLWPVSRESMPKQFVPLIGARSTFQQTVARIVDPTVSPSLHTSDLGVASNPLAMGKLPSRLLSMCYLKTLWMREFRILPGILEPTTRLERVTC